MSYPWNPYLNHRPRGTSPMGWPSARPRLRVPPPPAPGRSQFFNRPSYEPPSVYNGPVPKYREPDRFREPARFREPEPDPYRRMSLDQRDLPYDPYPEDHRMSWPPVDNPSVYRPPPPPRWMPPPPGKSIRPPPPVIPPPPRPTLDSLSNSWANTRYPINRSSEHGATIEIELEVEASSTLCVLSWSIRNLPFGIPFTQQLEVRQENTVVLNNVPIFATSRNFEVRTEPGEKYTAELRLVNNLNQLLATERVEWKAVFAKHEFRKLYEKAIHFIREDFHRFYVLYRCKKVDYWKHIERYGRGVDQVYDKDDNGQPASVINGGAIKGLFFSARLEPPTFTYLPPSSPFGDKRLTIPAERMLDPRKVNFYFADFYCNTKVHYITIVVCIKNSITDQFCALKLIPLDPAFNPFLRIQQGFLGQIEFYVAKSVWVEIYYTENVPTDWGKFDMVIGKGESRMNGLPNNKMCAICNLYPRTDRPMMPERRPLDIDHARSSKTEESEIESPTPVTKPVAKPISVPQPSRILEIVQSAVKSAPDPLPPVSQPASVPQPSRILEMVQNAVKSSPTPTARHSPIPQVRNTPERQEIPLEKGRVVRESDIFPSGFAPKGTSSSKSSTTPLNPASNSNDDPKNQPKSDVTGLIDSKITHQPKSSKIDLAESSKIPMKRHQSEADHDLELKKPKLNPNKSEDWDDILDGDDDTPVTDEIKLKTNSTLDLLLELNQENEDETTIEVIQAIVDLVDRVIIMELLDDDF